jgi:hypothetical protein
LGGEASYQELYPVLQKLRTVGGHELTPKWKQTVQGTIEENSPDSRKFRAGRDPVFYSVNGLGQGVWALYPKYLVDRKPNIKMRYQVGLEGISIESVYIRRSRDPRLAEQRKRLDWS